MALTELQIKCAVLMATGGMTQKDIAKQLDMNPCTISQWKRNKEFMQAVVDETRALFKDSLPDIYKALTTNSKEGSAQHIKIYLDHLEKLEAARANDLSITFTWNAQEAPTNDTDD